MRKRNFTLVEMLTVIAIIGVLAGILIPTVTIAKRRAQEAQARTEVNSIVAAIKAYRQQYNKLPTKLSGDTIFSNYENDAPVPAADKKAYVEFMRMLGGDISADSQDDELRKANPRKTKFLTPRAKATESKDNSSYPAPAWLDPWGRPYNIFMDGDYNGKVSVKGEDLHGDIFVYSRGIDDIDNTKDDVISWVK